MFEFVIGLIIGIVFSAILFTVLAVINDEYIVVIVEYLIVVTIFIFIYFITLGVQHGIFG